MGLGVNFVLDWRLDLPHFFNLLLDHICQMLLQDLVALKSTRQCLYELFADFLWILIDVESECFGSAAADAECNRQLF